MIDLTKLEQIIPFPPTQDEALEYTDRPDMKRQMLAFGRYLITHPDVLRAVVSYSLGGSVFREMTTMQKVALKTLPTIAVLAITQFLDRESLLPDRYFVGNADIGDMASLLIVFTPGELTHGEIAFLCGNDIQPSAKVYRFIDVAQFNEVHERHGAAAAYKMVAIEAAQRRLDTESLRLASRFYDGLIAKIDAISRPPLMGNFVLNIPPVLAPLLPDALRDGHFRIVLKMGYLYASLITTNGQCIPFFWSPHEGDNIGSLWLPYLNLPLRVFSAAIYLDAVQVEDVFRREGEAVHYSGKRVGNTRKGRARINLPRRIYHAEWNARRITGNDDFVPRKSPRAHYKRLRDGTRRSARAERNAQAWGFPEPPDGYTFACPSGLPPEQIPQIVSSGLNVAATALGGLV